MCNERFNKNLHVFTDASVYPAIGGVLDKKQEPVFEEKLGFVIYCVWPEIKVLPTPHVSGTNKSKLEERVKSFSSPHSILTRQSWIAMKILL